MTAVSQAPKKDLPCTSAHSRGLVILFAASLFYFITYYAEFQYENSALKLGILLYGRVFLFQTRYITNLAQIDKF